MTITGVQSGMAHVFVLLFQSPPACIKDNLHCDSRTVRLTLAPPFSGLLYDTCS